MTGSAAYARSGDAAAVARERLDRAAALAGVDGAFTAGAARRTAGPVADVGVDRRRRLVGEGVAARVHRPVRAGGVPARPRRRALRCTPRLGGCGALRSDLRCRRTEKLAVAVTDERAPFLAGSLQALLDLDAATTDDTAFDEALRYWTARVDEHLAPRRDHPHKLVASQRLFGGGEIHADLAPSAFLNVMGALDAWTQDPDPDRAPHQRTLAERRADALDDMAHFSLTGHTTTPAALPTGRTRRSWAEDTFDGCPTHRRPRRSPTTSTRRTGRPPRHHPPAHAARRAPPAPAAAPPHPTPLRRDGERPPRPTHPRRHPDIDDLDDLVLRGEGWPVTKHAAERLFCDSALVATLFAGTHRAGCQRRRRAVDPPPTPSASPPGTGTACSLLHPPTTVLRRPPPPPPGTRRPDPHRQRRPALPVPPPTRPRIPLDADRRRRRALDRTDRHGTTWTGRPATPTDRVATRTEVPPTSARHPTRTWSGHRRARTAAVRMA